jgi:hypothetical protein
MFQGEDLGDGWTRTRREIRRAADLVIILFFPINVHIVFGRQLQRNGQPNYGIVYTKSLSQTRHEHPVLRAEYCAVIVVVNVVAHERGDDSGA